jgi:hypothetical protein
MRLLNSGSKAKSGKIRKNLRANNSPLMEKPDMSPASVGRIAQVFLNVDLRNSHDGLLDAAVKGLGKENVRRFPPKCFLVFINHLGDRFKIMTPARHTEDGLVLDWAILYYRSPSGRITPDIIYNLPKLFAGKGSFEIHAAAKEYLQEELRMKRIRTVTPTYTIGS